MPLLTLRAFMACKKCGNIPTFSMTMRNKQRNFRCVTKTSFVFIGFTRHTQRNVFETEIINYCGFYRHFFFFCNTMLHCTPGLSNNAVKKVKVHGSQIKLIIKLFHTFEYKRSTKVKSWHFYICRPELRVPFQRSNIRHYITKHAKPILHDTHLHTETTPQHGTLHRTMCTHVHIYISYRRRYIYGHICFIDKWTIAKSWYLADSAKLEQDKELILPQYLHKKKVTVVATRGTLKKMKYFTLLL